MAHKIQIDIVANDEDAQRKIEEVQRAAREFATSVEQSGRASEIASTSYDKLSGTAKMLKATYTNLDKRMQQNLRTGAQLGEMPKYIQKNLRKLESQIHKYNKALDNNTKDADEVRVALKHLNAQYATQKQLLAQVTPATTSFSQRMGNLIKSFVSAQVVVFALRTAVSGTINLIKEMSKVAADAEETFNLFNVTFDLYTERAHAVISQISSDIKMARSSVAEAVGTVGDLLIGFGEQEEKALATSEAVTRLVADLMSFKNIEGDLTETISAFTSGILGNTRNLRRFGVVVRDNDVMARLTEKGLENLTGQAFELAKVYERLNIVIEQSPNAIGDMERTLNSTVNVQRRLNDSSKEYKELLGKEINEVMTPIKAQLADIIEGWVEARRRKEDYLNYTPSEEGDKTKDELYNLTEDIHLFPNALNDASGAMASGAMFMSDIEELARMYDVSLGFVLDKAIKLGKIDETRVGQLREQVSLIDKAHQVQASYQDSFIRTADSGLGAEKMSDMKDSFMALLGFDLDNLVGVSPEEFADAIDVALGKISKSDAIEEQMDKLEEVYRLLDQFGADPSSTLAMRSYVEKWKEIVKQQYESAGLSLERLKQIEEENKEAKKLSESNKATEERYKTQLALMKAQDQIAIKYGDKAENIVALEQQRLKALQGITDPGVRDAINSLYDYQVDKQEKLNALEAEQLKIIEDQTKAEKEKADAIARQEEITESANRAKEAMSAYVESIREAYDINTKNDALMRRFAEHNEDRLNEDARHKQVLDELWETYEEQIKGQENYVELTKLYLDGLDLENKLYKDNLDTMESITEEMKKQALYQNQIAAINKANALMRQYGMSSVDATYADFSDTRQAIRHAQQGGYLTAEEAANAIEGAWQEYLAKIDGYKAIAEGIREGDVSKVTQGLGAVASQGGLGDIGQIAVAADPATAALAIFAERLMQNEELLAELEPILNIVTTLADYFAELLVPSVRAIVNILETFEFYLDFVSFSLRLTASAIRTVILPFEFAADALKTIWLALKDLKGKITFWTKEDDVTAEDWAKRREESLAIQENYLQDLEDIWSTELDIRDQANKDLSDALDEFVNLYNSGQISGEQLSGIVENLTGDTPDYITPVSTSSISRSISNSTSSSIGSVVINVNGSGSPQATAEQIRRELDTMQRQGR